MYYRKPNQELLHTSKGNPYEGYSFYAGDRQSIEDIAIQDPPDTVNRWYIASNGQWTKEPQEASFNDLVLTGRIDLQSAKERLIEKVKEIAYLKTSIAYSFESEAFWTFFKLSFSALILIPAIYTKLSKTYKLTPRFSYLVHRILTTTFLFHDRF